MKIIKNIPYGLIALYRYIPVQILSQVRLKTSVNIVLKIRDCPYNLFWDCFEHFLLIELFIIGPDKKTNERNIFRKRFSVTGKRFRFFYFYHLLHLLYDIGNLCYGYDLARCTSDWHIIIVGFTFAFRRYNILRSIRSLYSVKRMVKVSQPI